MSRACGTYERGKQLRIGFWLINLKEKNSLEEMM
jgi:hypothetical protein